MVTCSSLLRPLINKTSLLVAQKMLLLPLQAREVICNTAFWQRIMLLELLAVHSDLITIKYTLSDKENALLVLCLCYKMSINQPINNVSHTLSGLFSCPSNNAVLQQRLKVFVAGSWRVLLVTTWEGRVDVDASQRGHGLFAVWVGLVTEGQLGGGGGGGAGGFLRDEESNKEGNDHSTGPQQEGRAGDECSLREEQRNKDKMFLFIFFSFI